MRKKILSSIMVVFVAVLLVACSGKSKTDAEVNEAYDALAIQDRATASFTVPAKSGNVGITWVSKDTDVLTVGETADDKTTIKLTDAEVNKDVVLEATLKLKKSSKIKQFEVRVIVDKVAPVIKGIPEDKIIKVEYGAINPNYLAGITATDDVDGKVEVKVDASEVNVNKIGDYAIYYSATDAAGNKTEETATAKVGDTTAPTITGYKLHTIKVGTTAPNWNDGVTANDLLDGNVTVTADASAVKLDTPGSYHVLYRAKDKAGNESVVRVRVIVVTTAELALAEVELPGKTAKDLTLATTAAGKTVTWTTSNAEVIAANGKITRATGNKSAKLVATVIDEENVTHTREFWVQVRGTEVDLDATYKSSYSEIITLNPLMSEGVSDSDVYELLTDTLFSGDYDWEFAIKEGYAAFPGDFSRIKSDRNPEGTVDMPSIPYKRTLRMTSAYPYAVTLGTDNAIAGSFGQLLDQDASKSTLDSKWIITLRDDLKFADGTKIDTNVVEYSFQQYLNGKVNNVRANYLYNEDYVPLLNGKHYFDGNTEWGNVGFRKIDDLAFEITLTKLVTQYDLMGSLSIINLVHPTSYKNGFNATQTENNYGSVANPLVSYGPFTLKNDYEDTNKFEFTRNENHYANWDVPYKHIVGPIIKDQTQVINEFKAGNLDVAGVGGEYWNEYKDNENLYIAPSNSFYRLAISIDRPEGRGKPIMTSADFRRALYLATDRNEFADTVQPPSEGALGFLSNIHQVSEWATQAYASSTKFGQQLEELGLNPEQGGFNSTEAKELFDKARAELVAAGKYGATEVVKIEYLFYDAGSNTRIANWVKAKYEEVFNAGEETKVFEVVLKAVSNQELSAQRDAGDFDLVFTGMSGATFQATFGMGYIFSPTFSNFLVGRGHDVPNLDVKDVDITNLYNILADKTDYDKKTVDEADGVVPTGMRTESEQAFFDKLSKTEGVFTGKFDELFNLYMNTPELDVDYEGQEEDLTNITAALEGALLEQMIAVPLFSSTSAAVYSSRVVREAHAYHLFLGWGGMSYTYIKNKGLFLTK